jgi:hypothetical protein
MTSLLMAQTQVVANKAKVSGDNVLTDKATAISSDKPDKGRCYDFDTKRVLTVK